MTRTSWDKGIDDTKISGYAKLTTPEKLADKIQQNRASIKTVKDSRRAIRRILAGKDDRILVVVGPCSIHNPEAGVEYAKNLQQLSEQVGDVFLIVMRTYFEKPRTSEGWPGLVYDPDMDGSYKTNKGLKIARNLLRKVTSMGMPCATEFLDPLVPQFLGSFISWAAIGARTTESQTHRWLTSGLSMPVGFKNSTNGSVDVAMNAMKAASSPKHFLGTSRHGRLARVSSKGNRHTHVVLRGGSQGPNWHESAVTKVRDTLRTANNKLADTLQRALKKKERLNESVMVDCSHDNCKLDADAKKDYRLQPQVFRSCIDQVIQGGSPIRGLMLESNHIEGSQAFLPDAKALHAHQSVTDGCISWDETARLLIEQADRVRKSRDPILAHWIRESRQYSLNG